MEKDDEPIKIGISSVTDSFIVERWKREVETIICEAENQGVEVSFQIAPGGAREQIRQIENLINEHVDVIIVIPEDRNILSPILKKAAKRKIPVLAYDRPVVDACIAGYISFDNIEVGRLMAHAMIRQVPQGKFLIVNGSKRDNNSYEINKGIYEVFDSHLQSGEICIKGEFWLEEWSYDEALILIESFLDCTTDIDGILAPNDLVAEAAIRVISEKQLTGEIAVVGQDADLLACQRIVEGSQLMTIYKPYIEMAIRAVHVAISMAEGNAPSPDQYLVLGNGEMVPYYIEKPVAVHQEQIESIIIGSGFHDRDDVYRYF
jgi:D-xylose transport system substrate-binding protein